MERLVGGGTFNERLKSTWRVGLEGTRLILAHLQT